MKKYSAITLLSCLIFFSINSNHLSLADESEYIPIEKSKLQKIVNDVNKKYKIPKDILMMRCPCANSLELAVFISLLKGNISLKSVQEGYILTQIWKDEVTEKTNKLVYLLTKSNRIDDFLGGIHYKGVIVSRVAYNGVDLNSNDKLNLTMSTSANIRKNFPDVGIVIKFLEANGQDDIKVGEAKSRPDVTTMNNPNNYTSEDEARDKAKVNAQLSEAIYGKKSSTKQMSFDIVNKLVDKDFEGLRAYFNQDMLKNSTQQIKEFWATQTKNCGILKSRRQGLSSGNTINFVFVFEKCTKTLEIIFDSNEKVSDIRI
ncbi:MAG: hypothetical protein AABZ74_18420 [Cyanobacteriota bacterium]